MSQYANLLTALLEKGALVIHTSVTATAVRKGLRHALNELNGINSIMDMPTIDKRIQVGNKHDGKISITLTDEVSGQGKFSFTLVETGEDGEPSN